MEEAATRSARLQQRILLLRELSQSLEEGRDALLRSDILQLQQQTARQQTVLEGLAAVTLASSTALKTRPKISEEMSGSEEAFVQADELDRKQARELRGLEDHIRRLGLVQAALLKNARRNLRVEAGLLNFSALTYRRPEAAASVKTQAEENSR